MVNDFVVVYTSHHEYWAVAFIPTGFLCFRLFSLDDFAQELDVARRKKVEAAIDVNDLLPGLRLLAFDFLRKDAFFG